MNPVVECILHHMRDEPIFLLRSVRSNPSDGIRTCNRQCFRSRTALVEVLIRESAATNVVRTSFHGRHMEETEEHVMPNETNARKDKWKHILFAIEHKRVNGASFDTATHHYGLVMPLADRYIVADACAPMTIGGVMNVVLESIAYTWYVSPLHTVVHSRHAAEKRCESDATSFITHRSLAWRRGVSMPSMNGDTEYTYAVLVNDELVARMQYDIYRLRLL